MNTIQLIANGTALDTGEINIGLNYALLDILDVAKRNTNYSYEFELEGTPLNNIFFQHIYDVNIDNAQALNPNLKIPAILRANDNQIFQGNLRLIQIFHRNKQIIYEVQFFGSLNDILKEAEDYKISDAYYEDFNHTRNATTIQNSWNYIIKKNGADLNVGEAGTGYVYPYIINGNSEDIFHNLYVYDLFPAAYERTVLERCFQKLGYTWTSNFLDSSYYKSIILPFNLDKIQMSEEQIDLKKTVVCINTGTSYVNLTPIQSKGSDWYYNNYAGYSLGGLNQETGIIDDASGELELMDQSNQWNGSIWTCAATGRYDVNWEGQLIPVVLHDDGDDIEYNDGQFEYRYILQLVKGTGAVIELDSSLSIVSDPSTNPYGVLQFGLSAGSHPTPFYDLNLNLTFNMTANNVLIEAGDKIRIRFGFRYPNSINWVGLDDNKHKVAMTLKQSLDGDFTKMQIVPASNESFGNDEINLSQTLPDIGMKQFLMDVFQTYNLVIQDNPDKPYDLLIEPYEDFFASRQRVVDWNLKVENDADIVIKPMSEVDAKVYEYTYTEDDDYYNSEYTQETKEIYGNQKVTIINDFSFETNTTKSLFSPSPSTSQFINGRVAPFFVTKDDEGFKPKKVKPRRLFYNGLYPTLPLYLKNYPNHSGYVTLSEYPQCGMWNDPFSPTQTLEFGRSKKIYWQSNVATNNTLYNRFHKAKLKNIIDPNARLLEGYFALTSKDISDFDFRDVIFFWGSYWRVNLIENYNPVATDSLTKVVMYKIVDITVISPFQIILPASNRTCPDNVVGKKTSKGIIYMTSTGLPISSDCCASFGGNMINGVCFADTGMLNGTDKPFESDGGVVPIADPSPISHQKNSNSINTLGVKAYGINNYAPEGAKSKVIIGDGNSIAKEATGTVVIGNNINATESNTIYLGNIKINQDGNIMSSGISIIDGGADEVFNFDKTNLIDIVDAGENCVRGIGGDSKARPIIDGNSA